MSVIHVHDVHKNYGDVRAVRGVSFEVAQGEVFCLLGPNGAGKTTITEIVEGHRVATSGGVSVLGHDPARGERALRDRIGVVLQSGGIQPELTVGELLEMHGRWYSRSLAPGVLIDLVELDAKRDTRAGDLSGGQRRRLDLALGLVGDPDVLFLDEPTTGFDPHARRAAWSTIRSLCQSGKTVFLTTHFMDEAQHLADRVAVMVDGQVVAIGPPEALGGRDELPSEIRFALPDGVAPAELPELTGCAVSMDAGEVLITTTEGIAATHAITGWALDRAIGLARFSVSQPTLEDVYLALTENATPEEAAR
ncbi:MAG: type transport system ATP-binding protein [Solirubrobacteraceae bacterium]|jgi:ABC-2 type transport system ATP-binding protein|nr:type transport system ATP-binding protein [Solirubrobacteraceae bacterium]